MVHLHGLTNRSADPFAGWRENSADPRTSESDAAKKAALAAARTQWRTTRRGKRPTLKDMANPLANQVRDVHRDRVGEQIEALADPQVMAVLPQGTGASGTAMFGAGFDPDALVSEVLTRLAAEPDVTSKVKAYKVLEAAMHKIVDDTLPAPYRAAAKAKFKITRAATSHDRMIGEVGASGSSVAPLQEALGQRGTFVARTPLDVQRDDAKAKATATAKVELTWTGQLKNADQLQPVLDADPADLTAEVREGKRVLATADTTTTVEVPAKPKKHTFKVVPTAAAPGDYFLAKKTTVEVDPAATKKVDVTLPYNRSNLRFTERTWEVKGISVAKANDVQSATLFGRRVNGGLNRACEPKVTAANAWFTANVSAADQATATASIVSLTGQVKRTQSRGTFSNHSTGTAIDIDDSESSLQNWHVKKSDKLHARAMRVFSTIVANSGVAELKDFDVWTTRDRDRLLQASERFNVAFPPALVQLVKDADPARTPAPTEGNVMALSAADLRALAALATTAKKPDVAKQLTDIAGVWYQVRAWIGGFVFARKGKKGEAKGMLRSEFEAKQAADKAWTSTGEMKGMISIHPAIVRALTEAGWSWLVDYRHITEKDFMHFEDRAGEASLRA